MAAVSPTTSHTKQNEVESMENVADRDQTGKETSSFDIECPIDFVFKGQQTTSIIENESGATSSQPPQPPVPSTTAAECQTQVPLKLESNVACLAFIISAGGILGVQVGLHRRVKTDNTQNILLKAYTLLSYLSFVSGVFLLLLTIMRPNIPRLLMIIKFTTAISLGLITYALTCVTSIIVAKTLVGVVVVLGAPLVIVFLLIILNFSIRKK